VKTIVYRGFTVYLILSTFLKLNTFQGGQKRVARHGQQFYQTSEGKGSQDVEERPGNYRQSSISVSVGSFRPRAHIENPLIYDLH